MKNKSKRGAVLLIIGVSLLLAAAGLYISNLVEDKNAGIQATELLQKLELQQNQQVLEKNGDFCGTVIIDSLDIKLPVFKSWDYERLKQAPCRYSGSIASGDMIIAAHNYKSHFGNLSKLKIGDEITFVDVRGDCHKYAVSLMSTLDGTDVTDMQAGKWDLSLFTCTKGGKQRVTVRCDKIN